MTITGIIFTFINLLLAVWFLLQASTVAQYRIDRFKKIEAEKAKLEGVYGPDGIPLVARELDAPAPKDGKEVKEPGLKRKLEDEELRLAGLRLKRYRVYGQLENAKTIEENQQTRLNGQLYALGDRLNDAKGRQENLSGTISGVDEEIQARNADLADMEQQVERVERELARLGGENDKLAKEVEAARAEAKKLLADNAAANAKLAALAGQLPEEGVAGKGGDAQR